MGNRIVIEGRDADFGAYIARPISLPAPAVVVLQELFGVNADIRETCDELAKQGYMTVAPDLFWRQEPGVDLQVRSQEDWDHGVRLYHDQALYKEAGGGHTPWHQDQPYYNVDGRGVSAWIAVDPVPADGCLELVAGSHRGPWLMPRTFLNKEARWFPEGSLAELPEIEADRGAFDIRRFELQPGDAIFFDFLTVHGAPGFPHRGRRRILSLRYLSAAARHAPRAWRTSPPFDGLPSELPAGAAMDHPLFPVVWPA